MRLTELEPHWVGHGPPEMTSTMILGITFLCPCCRTQRIGVTFSNPIVRGYDGVIHWPDSGKMWVRQGENFDDITITPSIDVSKYGHAHVTITNGEVL